MLPIYTALLEFPCHILSVNMGSPVALIIVSHRKDLELLEDFAGRNSMAVVSTEVGGLSGLGYFTQDD